MIIREARGSEDGFAIARVNVESWQAAYKGLLPDEALAALSVEERALGWLRRLQNPEPPSFTCVAETDGRIVGFVAGGAEHEGDPIYRGEVYAIYLLPAYQRRGIGGALLREGAARLAQSGFEAMLVWMLVGNLASRFYEAMGGQALRTEPFKIVGVMRQKIAYGWADIRLLAGSDGH
jgi:ribosomal protein S18 acetylase RimI-like enzyme